MADNLSRKLTAGKNDGIIPGITSSTGVEPTDHALFADDTLLLGGASLKMERVFSKSPCLKKTHVFSFLFSFLFDQKLHRMSTAILP